LHALGGVDREEVHQLVDEAYDGAHANVAASMICEGKLVTILIHISDYVLSALHARQDRVIRERFCEEVEADILCRCLAAALRADQADIDVQVDLEHAHWNIDTLMDGSSRQDEGGPYVVVARGLVATVEEEILMEKVVGSWHRIWLISSGNGYLRGF